MRAGAGVGAVPGRDRSDMSLIIVFLQGGLSTIDTWDMKPDAPSEIRGPFKPIRTKSDAFEISELLPLTAQQMQHLSLIRSINHKKKQVVVELPDGLLEVYLG